MEKVYVGWSFSNTWDAPAIQLMVAAVAAVALIVYEISWLLSGQFYLVAGVPLAIYLFVEFVYLNCGPANTDKYLRFKDKSSEKRWKGRRIPIADLVELYLEDQFEFKCDVMEALNSRDEFVSYRISPTTFKFLLRQFLPGGVSFYDKATSKREIADHYNRDCDFFNAFLGDSMVYTCAMWDKAPNRNGKGDGKNTLENAQMRKMTTICKKLQMKAGMKYLDIGCGWGTLVRHAEKYFGAKATGVTLSDEGAGYAKMRNEKEGCQAEILTMDYRDIPKARKFDRISAIEMAEHVGIVNFQSFLGQVKSHLTDDGIFLMQVAGLRQGSSWQDVAWGLFMARYIFPAADASTPLHWYVRQLEQAGFEVRSVETMGREYSWTLNAWYNNFMSNESRMIEKYPLRLVNLWKIFLAWSTIASGQGSATVYQLTCIKNTYQFDRDRFVGQNVEGDAVNPDPNFGAIQKP